MTTHAKIDQFLADAKRTDNLATTREMYARALELLRDAQQIIAAVQEFDGLEQAMLAAKPEDRL